MPLFNTDVIIQYWFHYSILMSLFNTHVFIQYCSHYSPSIFFIIRARSARIATPCRRIVALLRMLLQSVSPKRIIFDRVFYLTENNWIKYLCQVFYKVTYPGISGFFQNIFSRNTMLFFIVRPPKGAGSMQLRELYIFVEFFFKKICFSRFLFFGRPSGLRDSVFYFP